MKTGITTIGAAAVVVVLAALLLGGCVDNGLVAPNDSTIVLSANPATVVIDPNTAVPDPQTGRFTETTAIDALVLDESGFPMQGVSMVFRTTAGTLLSGGAARETNGSGVASDVLTVSDLAPSQVTVTALSGNLSQTTTVTVAIVGDNILPRATISVTPPNEGQADELITFDGTSSNDPDGTITCFQWTIISDNPDPGQTNPELVQGATTTTLSRLYSSEQNLTVTLKVSDTPEAGALCIEGGVPVPGNLFSPLTDTVSYSIVCANNAPTAQVSPSFADLTMASPSLILNGQASSDSDGQIVEYIWTCGGNWAPLPQDVFGSIVQCNYSAPGTYTATLTVKDDGNGVPGPGLGDWECQRQDSTDSIISVDPSP